MADFKKAIGKILKFEGEYVNDKNDSGGETKFGISKKAYPNLDIKNLTINQAKEIYKKDYWNKIKGGNIKSQKIAGLLFDTAVNMGIRPTIKITQKCLNVKVDGILGKITLKALNEIDEEKFIYCFKYQRIKRYVEIVKRNKKNRKFFFGWIKRVIYS